MEIVYENIIKAIIGESNNSKQFNEIIEFRNRKLELEYKIEKIKQKIKLEKQFNRKVELNKQLNILIKEVEEINNE